MAKLSAYRRNICLDDKGGEKKLGVHIASDRLGFIAFHHSLDVSSTAAP